MHCTLQLDTLHTSAWSVNKFFGNNPSEKIHLQQNNTTVKYDNTWLFQQSITVCLWTARNFLFLYNPLFTSTKLGAVQPTFYAFASWATFFFNSWHAFDACGIVAHLGLIFPSSVIHSQSSWSTCCIFESRQLNHMLNKKVS